MLRATREIEASVANGGDLWVGFQNADKLELEAARYARITGAGTKVVAFGTGDPSLPDTVALRWITLEPSTVRVENQWFLVTTEPEPIAFVSWEISDSDRFGQGGISGPDKACNTLERFRELLTAEVMLGDARGLAPSSGGNPEVRPLA